MAGFFGIIVTVIVGLLGLSFLVFIHEGGHFLVAKKMGVKVHTFSIGFGKNLFSFTKGGTEYCLKVFPFGGFVAMAGEQPDDKHTGADDEFASKSVMARIAIALGGPVVNIVFAFLAISLLYMAGIEEPIMDEFHVGTVVKDSPAEKAGLLVGDNIHAINGVPFKGFEEFFMTMALKVDEKVNINIVRNGDSSQILVVPTLVEKIGMANIGVWPSSKVGIGRLIAGDVAEKAGLLINDELLAVNGKPIFSAQSFVNELQASNGSEVTVKVFRENSEVDIALTPRFDASADKYMVGFGFIQYPVETRIVSYPFGESLVLSYKTNLKFSKTVFVTLKKVLRGKIPMKSLSGPVGIVQAIGSVFRKNVRKFVEFMALISLNLGIFNLLPLIITDGGLILFLILEAIRRKPLSLSVQMRINQVAVSFFIGLALFITYYDVLRIPDFF